MHICIWEVEICFLMFKQPNRKEQTGYTEMNYTSWLLLLLYAQLRRENTNEHLGGMPLRDKDSVSAIWNFL